MAVLCVFACWHFQVANFFCSKSGVPEGMSPSRTPPSCLLGFPHWCAFFFQLCLPFLLRKKHLSEFLRFVLLRVSKALVLLGGGLGGRIEKPTPLSWDEGPLGLF